MHRPLISSISSIRCNYCKKSVIETPKSHCFNMTHWTTLNARDPRKSLVKIHRNSMGGVEVDHPHQAFFPYSRRRGLSGYILPSALKEHWLAIYGTTSWQTASGAPLALATYNFSWLSCRVVRRYNVMEGFPGIRRWLSSRSHNWASPGDTREKWEWWRRWGLRRRYAGNPDECGATFCGSQYAEQFARRFASWSPTPRGRLDLGAGGVLDQSTASWV